MLRSQKHSASEDGSVDGSQATSWSPELPPIARGLNRSTDNDRRGGRGLARFSTAVSELFAGSPLLGDPGRRARRKHRGGVGLRRTASQPSSLLQPSLGSTGTPAAWVEEESEEGGAGLEMSPRPHQEGSFGDTLTPAALTDAAAAAAVPSPSVHTPEQATLRTGSKGSRRPKGSAHASRPGTKGTAISSPPLPPIKKPATAQGPPVMPPGSGVNRYRPPIGYTYGPVVLVHDNTSLRRMKLHASRVVKQLNATMSNTARVLQAWYRGERVRKRLRFLASKQAIISRHYRGYVVRRNLRHLHTVVVPIQAMVRGVLVRTVLRHWESRVRLVQGKTLLYVKRKVRERNFAATAIQRIMRGVLARAHYGKKSVLDHGAASKITRWLQRRFWMLQARRCVEMMRVERGKARKIQRAARAWRWRRRLAAAQLLQRNMRAFFVRRLIRELYIRVAENEGMRAEEEWTLMHEAEELAEEDMLWFLTEDPRGKESVEQKAKELRAEARERRKAFQDQSVKFHGGLPTTHPAFAFVRFIFKLYDVDESGYLDENELHLLLKHMAVPATEEEFVRAVEWADKDGSGHLNVDEFIVLFCYLESGAFPAGYEPPADWWEGIEVGWQSSGGASLEEETPSSPDAAGGASPVRKQERSFADNAKRTAAKLGMQGANLFSYIFTQNSTHHFLARRVLTRQARIAAAEQERLQFRFNCPPRVVCPACDEVFVFYSHLESHLGWKARTCPTKKHKVLPMRARYGLDKAFTERRKVSPVKPLVPEEYRMFAEHRVRLEKVVDAKRRQGRTAAPPSLVPSFLSPSHKEEVSSDTTTDTDTDTQESEDEEAAERRRVRAEKKKARDERRAKKAALSPPRPQAVFRVKAPDDSD